MGLFRDNETSRLVTDSSQVTQISEALQARRGTYGAPAPEALGVVSPFISGFGLETHFTANRQPHGGGAIAYPGHVGGLHAGGPAHDEQHVHRRVRGERRAAVFGSGGGGPTALACAWVVDGPHESLDGECCSAVSMPLLT